MQRAPPERRPHAGCARLSGDQRRLLGGLRHHGVAGDERGRDLAEKDRQREVPRADAHEHAASAIAQLVAFAGRPRHRLRGERRARLRRVVAAEVDRLADLRRRASSSVLPPSRCISAMRRPRRCSRRSPARSSAAARSSTGVACQSRKPACAAAIAARADRVVAFAARDRPRGRRSGRAPAARCRPARRHR